MWLKITRWKKENSPRKNEKILAWGGTNVSLSLSLSISLSLLFFSVYASTSISATFINLLRLSLYVALLCVSVFCLQTTFKDDEFEMKMSWGWRRGKTLTCHFGILGSGTSSIKKLQLGLVWKISLNSNLAFVCELSWKEIHVEDYFSFRIFVQLLILRHQRLKTILNI